MKNLCIALISACLAFSAISAVAQTPRERTVTPNEPDYNKPRLFADLPDRIDFNPGQFTKLFELQVGESVNLPIGSGFEFRGQVVSKSDASNATSVVIRSTNRIGARLVFTRVTDERNTVKYLGRIISMQHEDSYEIVSENNQYYLKKKGIYDLMNE